MVNDDIFTRRHQKTRIGAAEIKCFSSPTLRERKKKVKMFRHNGLTWGHWDLTLGTFSCHAVQCAVGWRRRGSTQDLKTNKVGVSHVQKSSNWPRYNTLKLLNLSKFSNNFSGKWLGNLEEKVCFLRQITSGKLSDCVHVLQPLTPTPPWTDSKEKPPATRTIDLGMTLIGWGYWPLYYRGNNWMRKQDIARNK